MSLRESLTPAALAAISPALSLARLGRLVSPPMSGQQLSRLAAGQPHTATTGHRVRAALALASVLAALGELGPPERRGKPRITGPVLR